jgi:competence transcription factor ComK
MDQEISIELLVDFIQITLKEELPRIVEEECDYQSMSSVGKTAGASGIDRNTNRSPSISSTNSSSCSV